MLKKSQKQEIIKEYVDKLADAKSIVFSSFQGLPTSEIQELRSTLRGEQVSYKVLKVSLLKRVLNQIGMDGSALDQKLSIAVSYSTEDEALPAKILHEFAKTHENLKVLSGFMDKQFVDASQVKMLANLPSKQELRGQVVRVIASPFSGLASVLAGNIIGLINVLNAKSKV